jgi:transcription antitermination factor NusG
VRGTNVAKTFYILQNLASDVRSLLFRDERSHLPLGSGILSDLPIGSVSVTQRGGALDSLADKANCIAASVNGQNRVWFAVQTRSKHERMVSHHLAIHGVNHFLPVTCEIHRWSDRRKKIELPLFPGYVFVQITTRNDGRVEVLRIPGVVRFVGSSLEGTQIPDVQIEYVRRLINENVAWTSYPFLKAGQRVRIHGGALDQVEGVFLRRNGEDALIVSIDAIQRSLAVRIAGYDVEAI